MNDQDYEPSAYSPSAWPPHQQRGQGSVPSILVAHPDASTRQRIVEALAEAAYDLKEASSATEVLKDLAHPPDLLIIDVLFTHPTDSSAPSLLSALQQQPLRATMATLALDTGAQQIGVLPAGADDVLFLGGSAAPSRSVWSEALDKSLPSTQHGRSVGIPSLPSGIAAVGTQSSVSFGMARSIDKDLPLFIRLKVHILLRLKLAERSARELLTRHHRDQHTLQNAAQRLAACTSLTQALTTTADIVRSGFGYDRVSISLYDPASQTLRNRLFADEQGVQLLGFDDTAAGAQGAAPNLPLIVSFAPGSPMRDIPAYQALFEHGQPVYYVPDTAGRAPAYFRPYLPGPVREALLVALPSVGSLAAEFSTSDLPSFAAIPEPKGFPNPPVGLITVDNLLSGRPFGPENISFLATLAGQAALAIERARLAEELQRKAREAEALAKVGVALADTFDPVHLYHLILEQAASVLPCDQAFVLLYADGWATAAATWGEAHLPADLRPVPLQWPSRPWFPTQGQTPIYLPDLANEATWQTAVEGDLPSFLAGEGEHRIRSLIVVPLLMDGEVLGTFNVGTNAPNAYSPHHVQLAAAFAERAATALRSARLYAAERERARAAEELARVRNDFVASVSHELRTPLTAIVGFAQMLQGRWENAGEAERSDWVEKIVAAAGRQQRLVEDLLLSSRFLDKGYVGVQGAAPFPPDGKIKDTISHSLQPRAEPVVLRTVAQRAAEEVQASYPGQRIDIVGNDTLAVLADPDRVLQVVINLVDNAAKYSQEGTPIIIWWDAADGMAALRVMDRGSGIPPQGREYLFTRFGRVPGSRMRAGRVGTGLGLFLGRNLARAMGGDLDMESTGPDGSTFRLRLPLASSA